MRETAGEDNDISGPVAEIESIKGNTLVWNQLFRQPISQATSGYNFNLPFTTNSNVAISENYVKYEVHTKPTLLYNNFFVIRNTGVLSTTKEHKVIWSLEIKTSRALSLNMTLKGRFIINPNE